MADEGNNTTTTTADGSASQAQPATSAQDAGINLLDAQNQAQAQQPGGATPHPADAGKDAGKDAAPKDDGGDLLDADARQKEIDDEQNRVPDKYEDFTLPEGFTLEGERRDEVMELFRQTGLSQAKAQSLVDYYCKARQAEAAQQQEALAKQISGWRTEVRSRPEYEEERIYAVRGMRAVVKTPEEIALFKDSALASHPAMWGVMVKVGRLVGEDGIGRGAAGAASAKEERFHVNMETL